MAKRRLRVSTAVASALVALLANAHSRGSSIVATRRESSISLRKIASRQRLDRPVQIRIWNGGPDEDTGQLVLYEMVRGGWNGVGDIIQDGRRGEIRSVRLPPGKTTVVTWYPRQSKEFKIRAGRKYMIELLGEAALMGGGRVWHSDTFIFVEPPKSKTKQARRR